MVPNIIDWRCFVANDGTLSTAAHGGLSARTGAGIYTVTLDQPIAQREMICSVQTNLAAGAPAATATNFKVINTSDTVKGVRAYTTAALADIAFSASFGALQLT